jgi:hypothetical protein
MWALTGKVVGMAARNVSKAASIVGWILGVLPALLLVMSAVMKLMKVPDVVKGMGELGYSERLLRPLGVVELCCAVIYLFPRTGVLGAILMTGYLGGATATNVRVGNAGFFLPALLGVVAWLGLYLRDRRLRELVPFWQ